MYFNMPVHTYLSRKKIASEVCGMEWREKKDRFDTIYFN